MDRSVIYVGLASIYRRAAKVVFFVQTGCRHFFLRLIIDIEIIWCKIFAIRDLWRVDVAVK